MNFINSVVFSIIFISATTLGSLELFAQASNVDHSQIEIKCSKCIEFVDEIINAVKSGANNETLKRSSQSLCPFFNVAIGDFCDRHIDLYFPSIKYMIDHRPDLTGQSVCSILLQNKGCDYLDRTKNWDIHIDTNDPGNFGAKNFIPSGGDSDLVILQLTDFHYDPKYKIGSNAKCDTPLCCRDFVNDQESNDGRAGKWGDYRCDSPWIAIENMLSHIQKTHKNIDYIYITGDYVDHATWETSWEHSFESISKIYDEIIRLFPSTPLYPLIGNHEPHPSNMFSETKLIDPAISSKPLYDFLIQKWNWLPETAKGTISVGGYYTTLVRPGLRIIAINNNVCFVWNLWLLFNTDYMIADLQWLHDALLQAEKDLEKVHLLVHIPSSHEHCYKKWSNAFNRIVYRFRNTISAQFNGHSHRDHFNLYFSNDHQNIPINVAWNGASATSHLQVNPNYRLYTVEAQTYQVVDHATWIFNLTEANENGIPKWFLEYKFREAYKISELSPARLYELVHSMAHNYEKVNDYWKRYVKQGDLSYEIGCNDACLAKLLCDIVASEYNYGNSRCRVLQEIFLNETIRTTIRKDEF